MKIFNVPIHDISKRELLHQIGEYIQLKKPLRIATINPEFLLRARRDLEFSDALCHADICVRDGYGIALAYWIRGSHAPDRITGVDLVSDLLAMAHRDRWTVCVINHRHGLSTLLEIKERIQKKYPNIQLFGFDLIPPLRNSGSKQWASSTMIKEISTAQVILASLGAPQQELLLRELQEKKIPAIMMGVGGAFDFMTGKVSRAPGWMQRLGFEWLFRLIRQPSRVLRIFRAVIVFPTLLIFEYILKKEE